MSNDCYSKVAVLSVETTLLVTCSKLQLEAKEDGSCFRYSDMMNVDFQAVHQGERERTGGAQRLFSVFVSLSEKIEHDEYAV